MDQDNLVIYYHTGADGNIKGMIDELMGIENSPYFRRRSRSEVARLVLIPVLEEEISKYLKNTREMNPHKGHETVLENAL